MRHPQKVFRAAVAAVVVSGLAVGVPATSTAAEQAKPRDAVQTELNGLVADGKFPAALAAVRGRDGRLRNYTAGVADLHAGGKVPVDGQIRIASNTKTFVATVVLQLVGEGRIGLDAPVSQYLPGLLDSYNITVRQLLQHTTGLPDYAAVLLADGFLPHQHTYYEPRELLDAALTQKAEFPPGTRWKYSNTNYVVAGLLVQKVTGRPIGEVITERVIKRAGLRNTYWPNVGEQDLRGRHPQGYYAAPGEPLVDVTVQDTSMPWAAGALVSTPSDLLKFFTALVGGKLLKPEQLKQMQTTVPAPEFDATGKSNYGLGLATFALSCGGVAWTHGGDIPGFETRNAVTTDGRGAAVAVTALPRTMPQVEEVEKALDTALCR